MKIGTIIEARMTSSRLPGKHMLRTNNKYIFEVLIEQLSHCKLTSQLILATTVNKEDDGLSQLALSLGVAVYRGNEENVYERVLGAALTFNIDVIVEITADCPLIDPNIVDSAVSVYLKNGYHYVSNAVQRYFPDGMDVQVFSTEVLRASRQEITEPEWLEHVTLQFRNETGRSQYSCYDMEPMDFGDRSDLEVTRDEYSDFILIDELYRNLNKANSPIVCSEIVNFIDQNPELIELYKKVERKPVDI